MNIFKKILNSKTFVRIKIFFNPKNKCEICGNKLPVYPHRSLIEDKTGKLINVCEKCYWTIWKNKDNSRKYLRYHKGD